MTATFCNDRSSSGEKCVDFPHQHFGLLEHRAVAAVRDFLVARARNLFRQRARERRRRGLVERTAKDQGAVCDFSDLFAQIEASKGETGAGKALRVRRAERGFALGNDARLLRGKSRRKHARDRRIEHGLHAGGADPLGHRPKRRACRLGKAASVSATISAPKRLPWRSASSSAVKAPNPLPNTALSRGSFSA